MPHPEQETTFSMWMNKPPKKCHGADSSSSDSPSPTKKKHKAKKVCESTSQMSIVYDYREDGEVSMS